MNQVEGSNSAIPTSHFRVSRYTKLSNASLESLENNKTVLYSRYCVAGRPQLRAHCASNWILYNLKQNIEPRNDASSPLPACGCSCQW